jgi:hypothetical protein
MIKRFPTKQEFNICVYILLQINFSLDDFTPAAIDKNKEAKVNIGARNDVAIEFPHVEVSARKSN